MASSIRPSRSSLRRPRRSRAVASPSVSWVQTKIHLARVAPQALEEVVLARPMMEDMNHHLDVVEKHPPPSLATLDVPRPRAVLGKGLLHRFGDRPHLQLALGGTNQEVVRDTLQTAQ